MLKIKQTPRSRMVKHGGKAKSLLKTIRNITISAIVLVALLVGAAAAYAWYTSKYGEQPKVTSSLKKTQAPIKSPTKPSPTGPVNAAVQMITTPIAPGENASITVRTNADAKCTIKVEYGTTAKVVAVDSGLVPKQANEFGTVNWTWTVAPSAPLGKSGASVTCANLKNSGVVVGDFVVAKK